MDNFRPIHGQDYGILRKKENKDEELFVFGYSCKIYEDYDKSLYVDQGKHLIPWLGDENLKIDRYDCRGALNDLTKYLPKSESFDLRANLSSQEKRIEQLCDEERYKALTTNEEEDTLYQEEELKRLQQALNNEKSYSEVGFSYENNDKSETESVPKETTTEEESEAFIPPYRLDVPVGMKIPKTKKHHEIIERTAFFINDQGPQMEILLKIKQAENPQFNFLSFDNELHPYYRHLLMAVKSEKYKPMSALPTEKETSSDETYLHPSLVQASQPVVSSEPAPKIPTIAYKPSADCTYSALVNRIKETQTSSLLESLKKNYSAYSTHSSDEKDISAKTDGKAGSTSSLPLSALTKSARRRRIRKEKHKAAAASFKIYYTEDVKNSDEDDDGDEDDLTETDGEKSENNSSENLRNSLPTCVLKPVPAPAPIVKLPPLDMQLIIDKMASYVAKNGRDFENVVENKGDPRFSFLSKDHEYNPYYQQKVQLYLQLENPQTTPVLGDKVSNERSANSTFQKSTDHQNVVKSTIKVTKSSKSKQPTPICFSIKKPKDQETLEIKSALPYEESEGEEGTENEDGVGENLEERTEETVQKNSAPEIIENSSVDQIKQGNAKKPPDMTLEKWARERLQAKLVTVAKEKLAAKAVREKDKQLQAERRKKAAEFINLLQKDNLVNKTQASETIGDFSTSGTKKDASDVITIPSDSSISDSDSIVSVPLSDDEPKQKHAERKSEESNNALFEVTKKRLISSVDNKNSYARTKHRDQGSDYRRSHLPLHSKHSHRYKKYDKDKKPYNKKKKHRHSRDDVSSSSNKKSYKKNKKRSRYSSEGSGSSSSDSSYSSDYKK